MILTAAALLCMGTAFAGNMKDELPKEAFNMSVNYWRLGDVLNLDADQREKVEYIHDMFCTDMRRAAYAKADKRQERLDKAVRKDLRYMRSVLDNEQYHKYVQLLNTTFVNRGLM